MRSRSKWARRSMWWKSRWMYALSETSHRPVLRLLTLQQKWAVREDLLSRVGLAYGRTAGGGVGSTILSVMDSLRRHFCASSKCGRRRRRDESRKMRDVRVYSVRKAPFKHPSSTTWSYAPRCDLRIVMKVIRLGAQSRERLHIVIPSSSSRLPFTILDV